MYTYAFFKTPEVELTLPPGIAGDVQVVGNAQISALVESALNLELVQQDDTRLVQAVLTHDRIICDLFWQTPILPLRFGTWFVSLDSLLTHLATNQVTYLEKLTQFTGKAEYTLKIVPRELAETPTAAEFKGKAYFLAKKQLYEAQVAQQAQQATELEQLQFLIGQTYPQHCRHAASPDAPKTDVEKIYLLIDRRHEGELYDHLQQWQNRTPLWELILGEALPPYHFV
jgi:Gas vesicle synthesis protein GvpL/GvpF